MAWDKLATVGQGPRAQRDFKALVLANQSNTANDQALTLHRVDAPDECWLEIELGALAGTCQVKLWGSKQKETGTARVLWEKTYAADEDNRTAQVPVRIGYTYAGIATTNAAANTVKVTLNAGPAPREGGAFAVS